MHSILRHLKKYRTKYILFRAIARAQFQTRFVRYFDNAVVNSRIQNAGDKACTQTLNRMRTFLATAQYWKLQAQLTRFELRGCIFQHFTHAGNRTARTPPANENIHFTVCITLNLFGSGFAVNFRIASSLSSGAA